MKNKGQEEMVGFVIIVVLVTIALLILLAILLRIPSDIKVEESREVLHFLESSSEITTDCSIGRETDFVTLSTLLGNCVDNKQCFDGRTACVALNDTYTKLLTSSWLIGEDRPIHGYSLRVEYIINSEQSITEEILNIEAGVCKGTVKGAVHLLRDIDVIMRVCFANP